MRARLQLPLQKSPRRTSGSFPSNQPRFTSNPATTPLKNYHTNVYADTEEQTLTVEMLGRQVQIRATPVSYIYNYGDGTVIGPVADPGRALPADTWDVKTSTSHQYQATGDYTVQITTIFTGEYKVEDGPWQQIDGTAEVASDPQSITVWRTKSGWVDRACEPGSTAWGC